MDQTADKNRIIHEVRDYIHSNILIGVSESKLNPNDSFLQKGILDSTGVLELVEFIEMRYQIKCRDEEITPDNLDTLNSIGAFVQRKLNP
jgi:acyl carrier protein